VTDLLSRMTLEEKIAQLEGAWENKQFFSDPQAMFVDEKGAFLPERASALIQNVYRRNFLALASIAIPGPWWSLPIRCRSG